MLQRLIPLRGRLSKSSVLLYVGTAILVALLTIAFAKPSDAATTVPLKMNFQGRLTTNAGVAYADGLYNMRFRIFDAATAGVQQWTETRETTTRVQVTNGLFSTQLGDVTALPVNIFTNTSLYFEIELPTPATATCATAACAVFSEGAMTPRNKLATSAYAFNSDTIDGIDGVSLARNDTANTFSGSNTFNGAVAVDNSTASAFIVKNGASQLLNADASTLSVKVGSGSLSDAVAVTFVLDTKNTAGDPTGVNGAMYYNSSTSKFRCFQAAAWTDCVAAGAGGTPTLQDTYNNSTTPATITTTAAKGVSIAAGAPPTADMFTVTNTGQGVTSAGVSAIGVNYAGGTGAIEGEGIRLDYAPGPTTGSIWSGLRIVADATGPAAGVTSYGIKLEGPTIAGAGTSTSVYTGTGWDIGVDIQSGGIQLAAQNDPAAPTANNLRIYAKDIAGRVIPKWISAGGVDTSFQASLGFNRISMMSPAGGTALTTFISGFGSSFTNTGTAANPTPTSTNLMTSTRRATFSTGATAGTVASHRQSVQQVWRGNVANMGGFFYTIRFGTSALQSGNRAFVGMSDSVAAPTNVDPTTNTTPGKIGVAINANTGNWNFVNNITGTAPTVTPLGVNFPVNTTSLYELVLYSAPNSTSVGYRLNNISTGNKVTGSVSTNLPANTTFLAPQFWITNNATAAAAVLDFGGWYLESDN